LAPIPERHGPTLYAAQHVSAMFSPPLAFVSVVPEKMFALVECETYNLQIIDWGTLPLLSYHGIQTKFLKIYIFNLFFAGLPCVAAVLAVEGC
jgi:hypothetical protein